MITQVCRYLDARRRRDEAEKQLDGLTAKVTAIADALKHDRRHLVFVDVYPEMPPEVTPAHPKQVSVASWPSAAMLQEIVTRWHVARQVVDNDWALLSDDDRGHLIPPER